jgi:competence protein ComEA
VADGRRHWLVPGLAGLGGLLAGVALVAFIVVMPGVLPPTERMPDFGEPLGAAAQLESSAMDPVDDRAEIVVDVAGAVVRPGVHRLQDGLRVGDAIEAAGGFAPRADLAATSQTLNLAQPLADGTKVLVPELGIDRPGAAGSSAGDGRIDLNGASQVELETLPGIGPVTAGKIIAARAQARFVDVGDLRTRSLVGESVFEDVKDLVRAG